MPVSSDHGAGPRGAHPAAVGQANGTVASPLRTLSDWLDVCQGRLKNAPREIYVANLGEAYSRVRSLGDYAAFLRGSFRPPRNNGSRRVARVGVAAVCLRGAQCHRSHETRTNLAYHHSDDRNSISDQYVACGGDVTSARKLFSVSNSGQLHPR